MTVFTDAISGSDDHAVIALDVSAGAKKERFPAGYNEWRKAIVCHVSAPAVGGKANRAIIACVADALGVRTSAVSILSGATSTQKRVEVRGISRDSVAQILKNLLS
ncbi:DUF167 domain-containing protein [Methanofollis fontis]|uniref:UPF0235 protein CUJ86_05540 n=1 Tax=Methanofollis fontis TaxID=2052832 RepID=A0A483CXR6_9EURY|nr:DUF167 domain-containing protein [Methanofollis fontis]TAJ44759.1 YggU family protein [Methanofollis fontis]